jgi:hypothetical protein
MDHRTESQAERQFAHRRPEKVPVGTLLPADSPRIDGEDDAHVRVLAELGGELPPIVIHRSTMRVIDGMHRLRAAVLRGDDTVDAHYFDGTDVDAFVLAVELNGTHGLPLSAADRRTAVERILGSHPHWSDQVIASTTGVSDKTVAAIRQRSTSESPELTFRIGRDGRRRPVNSAGGRLRASELIAARPDASLRDIAANAGIALATARDVRERVRRGDHPVPERQRSAAALELMHGGADTPAASPPVSPDFYVLARDPALRSNEEGRALLRLLSLNMVSRERWERIIDNIPAHCASTVAEAARTCSTLWNQVAGSLDDREARVKRGEM